MPPAASDGCATTLHHHPRPRERSISDAPTWGVRDHECLERLEDRTVQVRIGCEAVGKRRSLMTCH
jgi:hypothetical protein